MGRRGNWLPKIISTDKKGLSEIAAAVECNSFAGFIMIIEHQEGCYLLAYEHGAEYPDSFLKFTVATSTD